MVSFLALLMVFSVEVSLRIMWSIRRLSCWELIFLTSVKGKKQDELSSLSLQYKYKGMAFIDERLITDSK